MNCCDNINIGCKNYEYVCINCGTIHDYKYVNEISFRDYNMVMLNRSFYKKAIYNRKKYLYKKCLHIKQINENVISFFDDSLEDIRILYNMKRIYISKYLNSIYKFYCNRYSINYKPIFRNKEIINLNNDIIKILEKNYLEHPYVKKDENDYHYL